MGDTADRAPETERERMAAGLWYDANFDGELRALREAAKDLAAEFSATPLAQAERRNDILHRLIGSIGDSCEILPPLYVDYGTNISLGEGTFINHGAYLMDCAPIAIGSGCFIGPYFGAYTAQHPLVAEQRNPGLERALPITIGDNCWLGASVAIMPGVTIGEGCVIAAGSLVTHDIPAGSIAMGSPARVARAITDEDRIER